VPDRSTTRTERLLLRRWRDEDLAPFADLNADDQVMAHFPAPLSRAESDGLAARADAHLAEHGWGLWAVEVTTGPDTGRFAGFTGLAVPTFEASFTPGTEVGWRLARGAWGHGYASEAGRAALKIGFDELGLPEIVSFTSLENVRSLAVMARLGMTRDAAGDFDHPRVPVGHRLRRHALCRLTAESWRAGAAAGHP
jgi:RimJ/RimL family protein N-acetyltransferase